MLLLLLLLCDAAMRCMRRVGRRAEGAVASVVSVR